MEILLQYYSLICSVLLIKCNFLNTLPITILTLFALSLNVDVLNHQADQTEYDLQSVYWENSFWKHIEETTHHDQDPNINTKTVFLYSKKFLLHVSVSYLSGILYLTCLWILLQLIGLEERPYLHADGLERVPASFPVHPHHTIICAVLSHVPGVLSPNVVSAIGIGWVAAVVPPPTSILSCTLFGRISRIPGLNSRKIISTSTQSAACRALLSTSLSVPAPILSIPIKLTILKKKGFLSDWMTTWLQVQGKGPLLSANNEFHCSNQSTNCPG